MKKIVINTSYDKFSVSHQAFLRLRELGQQEALKETPYVLHEVDFGHCAAFTNLSGVLD